jgi:hypothetical protein
MTKLARLLKELQDNWDIYVVIIGSIIVGIISLILSSVGKLDIAPVLSLTLTMLGLVAISLRRDRRSYTKITESLQVLSGSVGSLINIKAFSHQHEAYRFLIDVINRDGAKEAVFLQYSCRTSLDVLRTVLSKGAKVTVFLQHEDMAAKVGSQYQADRIKVATKNLRTDLNGSLKRPDKFKVYKYRTLGSVSGIKIDDRVLCMGWYVYKHVDQFTDKNMAGDEVELLGHNIAVLVVWKGTPEFEALNKTFNMLEKNYQRNSEEVRL